MSKMADAANAGTWRDNLEGPALEIAMSDSRFIRVCAGPGTGKSFAMRCRVARLLEDGISPEKILAVTFTRAAARDLRHELLKIDVEGADQIRASTLHSYCHDVLSKEQVLEFTGRNPRILLKFEVRFLLHDLKTIGRNFDESERMLRAYEASWARAQDEAPGPPEAAGDRQFQIDLIAWLKFHRAMLVGELATETLRYLKDNPTVDQRSEFSHILVDEYQDLNRANQMLIDMLSDQAATAVVGDEDQSIYATLQYAQPEGIRLFSDSHPGTHDIGMVECRRCPQKVVSVANSLIEQNANRATESITPRPSNSQGTIEIIQYQTIEDEAAGIGELVRGFVDREGVDPSDVIVLTPRRRASYKLRTALRAQKFEVHSYFFEEALDSELAQERFSLLALLVNPSDRVSLRCWLGFGHDKLGIKQYQRLRDHCYATGESPMEVLQQLADGTIRIRWTDFLVSRFRELDANRTRLTPLFGEDLVNALFPVGDIDLEEIRIAALEVVAEVSPAITADELYKELRIRILFPEPPPALGAVRLMSLHSSKGLSAKLVVVTSCVESWIPSRSRGMEGLETDRELEEQRRLFYVALTRTRDTLVLSSFRRIGVREAKQMVIQSDIQRGGQLVITASRFLNELGRSAPNPRRG
jgi:DNA helicase II / ATP-dependent DNA helicase PcrA